MTTTTPIRLVLGVTGGIAAYKAAELTRLLLQDGIEVQPVLTEAAGRFVTATTFQALAGRPVFSDLWDPGVANGMAHIDLSRHARGILIAPASADFLAKLAHGTADDLLSTLCLARDCPLLVVPAMNRQMWEHPATRRNIEQLRQDGVRILGPASGDQACGETGPGRMLEPAAILSEVRAWLAPGPLAGRRVLITAGPTFEAIDAVRGITNSSSGKMGYAVAQAALDAGAEVVLVSGPTALAPPAAARTVRVQSAAQMLAAVQAEVASADLFVAVAAVADYTPATPSTGKLKKTDQGLTLNLVPTTDILASVSLAPDPPFCVGFAAESENLHAFAEDKRRRKKLPLLAGNIAQHAIGADAGTLVLFDDAGAHAVGPAPKAELARALVARMATLYAATGRPPRAPRST